MRFATRQQLQLVHTLGSSRNALKVLGNMKHYFHIQNHKGLNVYYLNKEGRDVIGWEGELKWTLQVEHHLMRNDLYIYFGCPEDWKVEKKITFSVIGSKERYVVPDAHFMKDGVYYLLEVDRTQNMGDNKKKIELYSELNPIMLHHFGKPPLIIFYTLTDLRKQKLKSLLQEKKLIGEIYTREDLR